MPTFEVTSPDGRKFRVNAPEGATQEQIIAYAQQNMPSAKAEPAVEEPGMMGALAINAGHWLDKKAAGLREAVGAIPMVGGPIQRGLDAVDTMTGAKTPDAAMYRNGEADKLMAPVREQQPVTSFAGSALPDLAVINPLSMAALAAVDPGSVGQRATSAGLTYGLGKLGQMGGEKLAEAFANRASNKAASLAAQKVASAPRDELVQEAIGAGFKFPPASINPSPLNRAIEGMAGKISTQQGAALANEDLLKALAKKELGIPPEAPLTKDTLETVRKTAGSVYETLKGFGPIKTDGEFGSAVGAITSDYRSLVQDFPELANAKIEGLVKTVSKPEFNSGSAVELVKRLRKDARANFKAFDDPEKQALAKVQIGVSDALENLMERNLAATGNEEFMRVFRNARTTIAKTHTIEDALEESTGKIVASKIGKEYSKGKPLTGNLALIGKVAEAYPKAVQNVNTSMPGMSPLDYMAGIATGGATGNPLGMAAAFARPVVRGGLLSDAYQKAMVKAPSYELSALDKAMAKFGSDPELLKKLGGLLGVGGLQAYQ